MKNIIQILALEPRHCYFWGTHSGAEIDLIIQQGSQLRGIEVKRTTAPKITPSIRSAMQDLPLKRVDIIHAGTESFALDKKIKAIAATHLLNELH